MSANLRNKIGVSKWQKIKLPKKLITPQKMQLNTYKTTPYPLNNKYGYKIKFSAIFH